MKVTFMPGIDSVSGSMRNRKGERIVFTKHRGDQPGHGRMYIRSERTYRRTGEPSERELRARALFAQRRAYVEQLIADGKCRTKAEAWTIAKRDIL